jgi:hypothetical protein
MGVKLGLTIEGQLVASDIQDLGMELYGSLESSLHAKNVECLRRQSRVRRSDDVTPDIKIVIK